MAFASAANSTQRVGQYSPGDIAARPRRFAGGVRKQGESRDEFTGRMDAGYRASAMQATPAPRTRQDNIAAARGDGTFDAKRNAYNAANQSSYMDAQGNTGPKAPSIVPPAPSATAPSPAPMAPAPAKPAGFTGPPAPRAPATFDGQSKGRFFANAAVRGTASMPSGVYDQSDVKSRVTAYRNAGESPSSTATATTPMDKQAKALSGAFRTMNSPEAKKVNADIEAYQAKRDAPKAPASFVAAAAPKPSGANFGMARAPAPAATSSKPAMGIKGASITPQAPKTFTAAAQPQAVKNPQGLSARLNPPGAKPRGIMDDALVGRWATGEMKKLEDLKRVGSKVAGAFRNQATRNPQGIAAKAMQFFGGNQTSRPAMASR